MYAAQLINPLLLPLTRGTTCQDALTLMNAQSTSVLPVIENQQVLGYVASFELMNVHEKKNLVEEYIFTRNLPRLQQKMHLLEIMNIFGNVHLPALAVEDEQKNYLGIVTLEDTVKQFIESFSMREPGGVLTIELDPRDYSLAEISRLVEENGVKILSVFLQQPENNSNQLLVTLKLNQSDIKYVVATLQRFNYKVVGSTPEQNESQQGMKDRYDQLMKYLDI